MARLHDHSDSATGKGSRYSPRLVGAQEMEEILTPCPRIPITWRLSQLQSAGHTFSSLPSRANISVLVSVQGLEAWSYGSCRAVAQRAGTRSGRSLRIIGLVDKWASVNGPRICTQTRYGSCGDWGKIRSR